MKKGYVSFLQNSAEASTVVAALDYYAQRRLSGFASMMPDGKFMDGHNDEENSCIAIVLLAGGQVCPLFERCCLNPLQVTRRTGKKTVWLSPFSCGSNIDCRCGIIEGINAYNKYFVECGGAYADDTIIIGAWIF